MEDGNQLAAVHAACQAERPGAAAGHAPGLDDPIDRALEGRARVVVEVVVGGRRQGQGPVEDVGRERAGQGLVRAVATDGAARRESGLGQSVDVGLVRARLVVGVVIRRGGRQVERSRAPLSMEPAPAVAPAAS